MLGFLVMALLTALDASSNQSGGTSSPSPPPMTLPSVFGDQQPVLFTPNTPAAQQYVDTVAKSVQDNNNSKVSVFQSQQTQNPITPSTIIGVVSIPKIGALQVLSSGQVTIKAPSGSSKTTL